MSREYTLEERRGIAQALIEAKAILWNGQKGARAPEGQERFICTAIDKTKRWHVNQFKFDCGGYAKDTIQERMGGAYCLETWLKERGISSNFRTGFNNRKKMQAYRHRWLDALIEEFSK